MSSSGYLTRLLQLASPALPVGAYSYSQGLESAIRLEWVTDDRTALVWIQDQLTFNMGRCEAPVWARLYEAWARRDLRSVDTWSEFFLATRDAAELRAETLQAGRSLARLLVGLPVNDRAAADALMARTDVPLPTAFTCAAVLWHIPAVDALVAYLWSWAENQVLAAVKAIPLGQTAGQQVLHVLGEAIPRVADAALCIEDDAIGSFVPAASLASYLHEVQVGRLFRS